MKQKHVRHAGKVCVAKADSQHAVFHEEDALRVAGTPGDEASRSQVHGEALVYMAPQEERRHVLAVEGFEE